MDTLTCAALSDPYYGLLSDPVGRWGCISYGKHRALILRGERPFIERALAFLHSFAGGRMEGPTSLVTEPAVHYDGTGAAMVPISERRLKRALSIFFWTQLYPHRAPRDRHLYDEEGEYVGTRDLTPAEDAPIMAEAEHLASTFYSSIEHDSLGADFTGRYTSAPTEHLVAHAEGGQTGVGADEGG